MRRTGSGNALLVGYVATTDEFDAAAALATLRATMPAALVPRLAQVDTLPTRTSGKIDRDALPWPLVTVEPGESARLEGTAGELQDIWAEILGAAVTGSEDDFFDLGGGSLAAAQLVSRLRATYPEVTVADVYEAIGGYQYTWRRFFSTLCGNSVSGRSPLAMQRPVSISKAHSCFGHVSLVPSNARCGMFVTWCGQRLS